MVAFDFNGTAVDDAPSRRRGWKPEQQQPLIGCSHSQTAPKCHSNESSSSFCLPSGSFFFVSLLFSRLFVCSRHQLASSISAESSWEGSLCCCCCCHCCVRNCVWNCCCSSNFHQFSLTLQCLLCQQCESGSGGGGGVVHGASISAPCTMHLSTAAAAVSVTGQTTAEQKRGRMKRKMKGNGTDSLIELSCKRAYLHLCPLYNFCPRHCSNRSSSVHCSAEQGITDAMAAPSFPKHSNCRRHRHTHTQTYSLPLA